MAKERQDMLKRVTINIHPGQKPTEVRADDN